MKDGYRRREKDVENIQSFVNWGLQMTKLNSKESIII